MGTKGRQSLVPGDDASSGVTAEADSPRGKPLWSRDAVLGVNHSYDLLQIRLSFFPLKESVQFPTPGLLRKLSEQFEGLHPALRICQYHTQPALFPTTGLNPSKDTHLPESSSSHRESFQLSAEGKIRPEMFP